MMVLSSQMRWKLTQIKVLGILAEILNVQGKAIHNKTFLIPKRNEFDFTYMTSFRQRKSERRFHLKEIRNHSWMQPNFSPIPDQHELIVFGNSYKSKTYKKAFKVDLRTRTDIRKSKLDNKTLANYRVILRPKWFYYGVIFRLKKANAPLKCREL